jgi:dTDP-4-dehydrorhamnose 3,5-epimerase-like enzyme
MVLDDCKIIELPQVHDPRGNLTFIEGERHLPFAIKRVYYLYDVPGGSTRAGHGHKTLQQLMIAMSGSFDIELDDGYNKRKFHLNRSHYGLYICPEIWRHIDNFSSGSVCMVLASDYYDESDYYRYYEDFLRAVRPEAVKQ